MTLILVPFSPPSYLALVGYGTRGSVPLADPSPPYFYFIGYYSFVCQPISNLFSILSVVALIHALDAKFHGTQSHANTFKHIHSPSIIRFYRYQNLIRNSLLTLSAIIFFCTVVTQSTDDRLWQTMLLDRRLGTDWFWSRDVSGWSKTSSVYALINDNQLEMAIWCGLNTLRGFSSLGSWLLALIEIKYRRLPQDADLSSPQ